MIEQTIKSGQITSQMNFNQRVWALTARIPRGKVATYGDIARALKTRAFRAVGSALNRNPYAPRVPCHRVVGSSGALTGFAGGIPQKRRMLLDEGVRFIGERVDLSQRCALQSSDAAQLAHSGSGLG